MLSRYEVLRKVSNEFYKREAIKDRRSNIILEESEHTYNSLTQELHESRIKLSTYMEILEIDSFDRLRAEVAKYREEN